ncbi:MAG: bacteriohopanetetrol glucosamine biosynthesis glycosyltransferase HpnI, partial [Candidatus Acidiferrales bacterium]
MWWTVTRDALMILALASFAYYVVAIFAALRFFGARRMRDAVPSDFTPPISILKPIYGLDRETYENYASFCLQDYPDYEILFCVSDDQDPAIPVIAELARNFPERSIQLIVGSEPLGVSDKVNKLCRMVRAAKHEIVVVSDSDVRVGPGYLCTIAAPFRDSKVGAVTCLYRGLTDGSLAANLEAIGNSTDFTAGVLVAWLLGDVNFTLGATMATTKTRLAEIGGFESLVDHFSDDYELGNRIAARGHRVELSTFPVGIVYPAQSLGDAFRHQLRWNLSIRYSRPAGHLGLIFTQGLPLALLAAVFAPSAAWAVALMLGYLVLRGASAWIIGVWGMGDGLLRGKMELLPLRDLFAFVVWVVSFFPQRIHWRGKKFYVREKRLVA